MTTRAPLLFGVLTVAGLVLALVSEGVLDVVALLFVTSPLVVLALRAMFPPRAVRARPRRSP